jgi:hypothetical protein
MSEVATSNDLDEHRSCPSHCCVLHGCKYSLPDCPVVLGKIPQETPCYNCESLGIDYQDPHWRARLDDENEISKLTNDQKVVALNFGLDRLENSLTEYSRDLRQIFDEDRKRMILWLRKKTRRLQR